MKHQFEEWRNLCPMEFYLLKLIAVQPQLRAKFDKTEIVYE